MVSYVPVWRATARALTELGCAAFFVGGLPGLLAAFLALRMQEPARGATEEGGASSQTKMPFLEGLRGLRSNSFYWVSVAGLTLMTFSIGGLAVFMPTFLEKERGVPAAQAAIVFGALLCVSGLVGTLVGGVPRRAPLLSGPGLFPFPA